jgi:hypothetical protein
MHDFRRKPGVDRGTGDQFLRRKFRLNFCHRLSGRRRGRRRWRIFFLLERRYSGRRDFDYALTGLEPYHPAVARVAIGMDAEAVGQYDILASRGG